VIFGSLSTMLNNSAALATGGGTVLGKAIGVQLDKNGSKVALAPITRLALIRSRRVSTLGLNVT